MVSMTEKELWRYFWDKKIAHAKPFDRDFVWVTKKDFESITQYFRKEFNILHAGKSMRSRAYIFHIHAIDQGEYVFAHRDIGNVARFFPLGILHLVFDVIPYFVWTTIKGISMNSIITRPQI